MIIKLNESHRQRILDYLYKDALYNIFPIGDIETFGFNQDFQRVYAEIDENEQYLSMFLRYHENAIYYSEQLRFHLDYLTIFEQDPFEFISGKTGLMALIQPHLKNLEQKHMFFCEAHTLNGVSEASIKIKKLKTKEEAGQLYDLLCMIDEFGYNKRNKDDFINQKTSDQSMGMTWFIDVDGEMASTAATTAETTKNAMVIAVATHPKYRHKGYASMILSEIMRTYINEKKKQLCLFYNNLEAGKIYHRLGFKTIGTWDMFSRHHS